MFATLEEVQPKSFAAVHPNPSSVGISRAWDLFQQANQLLLESGRLLEQAKTELKRKFTTALEQQTDFSKTQANQLIKAAQTADELPSQVALSLGLHLLLQLSRPSNQEAAYAIAPDDNAADVVRKLKEYRKPPQPKPQKAVRWKKNKFGDRCLVVEMPDCEAALEFECQHKESGLPVAMFLKQLLPSNNNEKLLEAISQTGISSEYSLCCMMQDEDGTRSDLRRLEQQGKIRPEQLSDGTRMWKLVKSSFTVGDKVVVKECDRGWQGCEGKIVSEFAGLFWVLLDAVMKQGMTTKILFSAEQLAKA